MKRFLLSAVTSLALASIANAAPTSPAHISNWVPSEHPQSIAEWESRWSNPQAIPAVTIWGTRENLRRGELFYIWYMGYPDANQAIHMHRWYWARALSR